MYRDVAKWIADAGSVVALTGAGISTESGIPDFRSPGGVWSKYRTVYFDEFLASADARYEYWRQKSEAHRDFGAAKPNAGHHALAGWEQRGQLRGLITQNIDELHQAAGSEHVLELHGTARRAACLDCSARFDIEPFVEHFLRDDRVPDCPECGGRLKHATISFGQSLPHDVLETATAWADDADVLLAIGSSLVVQPAAGLAAVGKHGGGKLVIINRDETPYNDLADAIIRTPIGDTLTAIDAELH